MMSVARGAPFRQRDEKRKGGVHAGHWIARSARNSRLIVEVARHPGQAGELLLESSAYGGVMLLIYGGG